MPGPGLALVGGVTDDTLINDAVAILGDTYDIAGYDSRISVFSGLAHHVLFLTNYILEQGRNPKDFGLLSVNITGGYLGGPGGGHRLCRGGNFAVNFANRRAGRSEVDHADPATASLGSSRR